MKPLTQKLSLRMKLHGVCTYSYRRWNSEALYMQINESGGLTHLRWYEVERDHTAQGLGDATQPLAHHHLERALEVLYISRKPGTVMEPQNASLSLPPSLPPLLPSDPPSFPPWSSLLLCLPPSHLPSHPPTPSLTRIYHSLPCSHTKLWLPLLSSHLPPTCWPVHQSCGSQRTQCLAGRGNWREPSAASLPAAPPWRITWRCRRRLPSSGKDKRNHTMLIATILTT